MEKRGLRVAVLGASDKPERYSNKAVNLLRKKGYSVVPVHPSLNEIDEIPVVNNLSSIKEPVHTLSIYVNPERISAHIDDIIKLKPGRVILNPGTESDELEQALTKNNIPFQEACTLVLLKTGQF